MNRVIITFLFFIGIAVSSCTTSKSVVSQNADLSKYEYASIINNDTYHIPAQLMEYEIQLFDAVEGSRLTLVSDMRINELTATQQSKLLMVKYGVDILEEEATADIQKLAGVSGGDEAALSPPQVTIRKRLPWLLANIGLYVGAASAIAPFQQVISVVPVLAVIMPILSNTSGNVAIQALSVTVRGLGVGEVTPLDTLKILRKEILAGLGTALALAIALGILSLIWSPPQERWVAIVAASVMAINVFVAASLGTMLPMGLKRLKLDPALISGPLLTTILDAVGFLTFLSLISLALRMVTK